MTPGAGPALFWRLRTGLLAALLLCACAPPAQTQSATGNAASASSDPAGAPAPLLTWTPDAFRYTAGRSVRYIDFANGDDRNDGRTRDTPWRHHPWDSQAQGRASGARDIDTYVFRRGVTYRGALDASTSGLAGNPIRLTSDPDWGSGDATLSGAAPVAASWRRCTLPAPAAPTDHVWCATLPADTPAPRLLWQQRADGSATRLPLAREPDWQVVDPDDPRSQWWELQRVILEVELTVDSADGFAVGDAVTGSGKWRDLDEARDNPDASRNRVTSIAPGRLSIESRTWRKGELKRGSVVTNGRASARISALTVGRSLVRRLVDDIHLTAAPNAYRGAVVWAERESMPKPLAARVTGSRRDERSLSAVFSIGTNGGPTRFDRYFLEGLPRFLDEPGEYVYDEQSRTLYLRLPGDGNPNDATILAARDNVILNLHDRRHIEISGLRFAHANQLDPTVPIAWRAPLHAAAIRIHGNADDIAIRHCRFEGLAAGIVASPLSPGRAEILDHIVVADNDFLDIDGSAIALGNGFTDFQLKDTGSRLRHVSVLRNRIQRNGQRTVGHWGLGTQGHAIVVEGGELIEIAGNHVDRTWGAGIMVFTGAEYSRGKVERPLLRTLVHHNRVTNSLLGLQDYGGISVWHGGPAYVFSNESGNAVGYKHAHHRRLKRRDWYRSSAYGVGIYLDSQYKSYVFNNVLWGNNNDVNDRIYNSTGFNEAMGFMNVVFNNTLYNFGVGIHKGMTQHNRSAYLGNLVLGTGLRHIQQEVVNDYIEYDTLSFADNVFADTGADFGQIGRGRGAMQPTLEQWRDTLQQRGAREYATGTLTAKAAVLDADAHDFRPRAGSDAIDAGSRVFVPWGLYGVAGEWHFLRSRKTPQRISDEALTMDAAWNERGMYGDVPRLDLTCSTTRADDFETGTLEDWTAGALRLDGQRSCSISHAALTSGFEWRSVRTRASDRFDRARPTLDMDTNRFLLEIVVRVEQAGVLAAKHDGDTGYMLDVDERGAPRLTLSASQAQRQISANVRIDDGEWHHLLVEVTRGGNASAVIYLDGRNVSVSASGRVGADHSLSNSAAFSTGCDARGAHCMRGAIDFLRVARGTLADAETDIRTLYDWQFNGPQLSDFRGQPITGDRRDAGALEYAP